MNKTDSWKKSALPVAKRRPPWCPSLEDSEAVLAAVRDALISDPKPSIVVLGITPETIQIDWPAGTRLIAVDSSPSIISSMWKPAKRVRSEAICAPWQHMPFDDGSIAAAVGDGSLNALSNFDDSSAVLSEICRVLRSEGVLALRCFVKPQPFLTTQQVAQAALRGAYPTTAAFRLPFAMALAGTGTEVRLSQLLDCYNRMFPDRDQLAKITGWPREDIDRADMDKDSYVRLSFPTEAELFARFDPFFELVDVRYGTYFQAEYCPTYHLRRRS